MSEFHTESLEDTIPGTSHNVEIYCASCKRLVCKPENIYRIYNDNVWAWKLEIEPRGTNFRVDVHRTKEARDRLKNSTHQVSSRKICCVCDRKQRFTSTGFEFKGHIDIDERTQKVIQGLRYKLFLKTKDEESKTQYLWKGDPSKHQVGNFKHIKKTDVEDEVLKMLQSANLLLYSEDNITKMRALNLIAVHSLFFQPEEINNSQLQSQAEYDLKKQRGMIKIFTEINLMKVHQDFMHPFTFKILMAMFEPLTKSLSNWKKFLDVFAKEFTMDPAKFKIQSRHSKLRSNRK